MEINKPSLKKTIKIVAVSDTHNKFHKFKIQDFPQANYFIHAGDITDWSKPQQFQNFRQFLKKLPYKHKIVIGGNHDFGLTPHQEDYQLCFNHFNLPEEWRVSPEQQRKKLREVCTYLEHDFIELQGVKFFGSPYIESPYIQGFYVKPQDGYQLWTNLPKQIDVMITHMPPFGILDLVNNRNFRVGSKRLREAIDIIKPKVHIFGHIHESFGHQKLGNTHFFNVAMLNEENNMREKPILIEFQV